MRLDTYSWGSQSLTGAASLRYRMPVFCGYSAFRVAQWIEHQTINLTVSGSNPDTKTNTTHKPAN
jgi:hypothetical protein